MACMYNLFNRVPNGMKIMVEHISEHLKSQGKSLVTEEENTPKNPVHYVTVSNVLHKLTRQQVSQTTFKKFDACVVFCSLCWSSRINTTNFWPSLSITTSVLSK